MEVRKTYTTQREMHLKPYQEIARYALEAWKLQPRITMTVRNFSGNGEPEKDCKIPSQMLEEMIGHPKGSMVEVIASGWANEEQLKTWANKIGSVFEFRTDEVSLANYFQGQNDFFKRRGE